MISWLKKHFIPHEGNEHRPHILRDDSIRSIVAVIIFLEIFTFLLPTFTRINMTGGMAAVLPAVLADLTNDERSAQNLSTLAVSPILNRAAEMKAQDMATKGYFAHTSPEGKTPWYWIEQAGYKYQYAGENLAINFSDSKDVTNAWMASPTHKANIVKGNYTEIGTGVATGIYEGKEAIFVAQVYANSLPFAGTQPVSAKIVVKEIPPLKKVIVTQKPTNVLGSETAINTESIKVPSVSPIDNPTLLEKVYASPRNTTNIILDIIFGIITLALLLYIFIKMKNHHKDLITNGFVVLAIIGVIMIVNHNLSGRDMVIAQSFNYANQNISK